MTTIISDGTGKDALIALLKRPTFLGLDIETTGLNPKVDKIRTIALGDRRDQIVIIWEALSEEIKRNITKAINARSSFFLLHNASFDHAFLWRREILPQKIMDTMLTERILLSGNDQSASLDASLKRRLKKKLKADISKDRLTHGKINDTYLDYAIKDVKYLPDLHHAQRKEINKLGLTSLAVLEQNVLPIILEMEREGMKLDRKKWLELSSEAKKDTRKTETAIEHILLNDPIFSDLSLKESARQLNIFEDSQHTVSAINYSSPKTILAILQCIDQNIQDTKKETLHALSKRHPIIKELLKYREYSKKHDTYGSAFFRHLEKDDIVRTMFNQILKTGRLSSKHPNLQQIPSDGEYRSCFSPAQKDEVFISADYSSQELCIAATGAGEKIWLDALKQNRDLHATTAEIVYGKRWKKAALPDCEFYKSGGKCKCPLHIPMRDDIKTINFGIIYGISTHGLSIRLGIPEKQANELLEKYFDALPKLKNFLGILRSFGLQKGYTLTYPPFKRRRIFPQIPKEIKETSSPNKIKELENKREGSIERQSMNTPIQGTAGDMMKLALHYLDEHRKKYGTPFKFVLNLHDEIFLSARPQHAQAVADALKTCMESAATSILKHDLLKAKVIIGKVWAKD